VAGPGEKRMRRQAIDPMRSPDEWYDRDTEPARCAQKQLAFGLMFLLLLAKLVVDALVSLKLV